MRYGSLCSGIGGLDRAIERVLSARPAWFCEADKHAASVLARHWPGVPVLPDIKTQDWTQVESVELVSAGYPCQPFSAAGQRRGTDDPRHLWPFVIAAVRVLRPRLVVLENVSGHLGLGFDQVLSDLAEAGFDAEWCVVSASAAGACHRRDRLFVVAHAHADSRTGGPANGRDLLGRWQDEAEQARMGGGHPLADACGERLGQHAGEPSTEEAGAQEGDEPGGDGARWSTSDATDQRLQRGGSARRWRNGPPNGCDVASDADSEGTRRAAQEQAGSVVGRRTADDDLAAAWGDYGPAIERWEHVLGRVAPAPIDEKGRLSVPFVEWMQGFDAGWVDDLTRTAALRCLGNAVVQQQGEMALRMLLEAA